MKIDVVVGLGFGDEGKGLVTDYLCSQRSNPIVVRFNGGHQAGHTVCVYPITHIFSNFGSGTLRGVPTYWSKFCTVDPIALINEKEVLLLKNVKPKIFIDALCPITTPYDFIVNRRNEDACRHGSCGVGFGTTIQREEDHHSLLFSDLYYPSVLKEKLKNIAEYYSLPKDRSLFFLEACRRVASSDFVEVVNGCPEGYETYIFEGAQGLLLDQKFGFFPHVTRSNTGPQNVSEILKGYFSLYTVTRAYQTRHGAGFMTNESIPHNIIENPKETNGTNYQGRFRRSLLDVSLLKYALDKILTVCAPNDTHLCITCLDHIVNDYRYTYEEEIKIAKDEDDFVDRVRILTDLYYEICFFSKCDDSLHMGKKE